MPSMGQQLLPLMCKETVNGPLRVLAYRKFKLSAKSRKNCWLIFYPMPTSWSCEALARFANLSRLEKPSVFGAGPGRPR